MTLDAAFVNRVSNTHHFQTEMVEKVLRLKELLLEFERHPILKGNLVLKGGTALNLFYLELARLSVDIDLNYVGEVARDAMLAERPRLEGAVEQICGALKYQVRRGTDEHALIAWQLGYQNQSNRPDHIEVEINFLYRVCAQPAGIRAATRFADEAECSVTVLTIEEVMAGKLTAMIDRQHPRDLYDLYRFKKAGLPHDPELLRKLAVLFGSTLPHDIREYSVDRCERVMTADLEQLLFPLLRADDRPTGKEMFEVVRPLLAGTLDSTAETAYLDAMAAGRYQPELLFPGQPEIVERIRQHPNMLWKAQNVSEHIASTKTHK